MTTISQNIPLSGGTIQAPVGNGKAEAATITIASGTQVKDASGNVINTTSVSTQVVHFGSAQLESLLSFPGGFTPQNVNINGTNTAGSFVTAGFVAIDMQAGGKEVKSFTKPIEVKVGISDDFTNPDTNEKLKEGDTIPTWSYENSTGEWTREGEAKVTKDASGKLIATFTASHLSYWNLDYFYELGPKCGKYYTFVKTSSNVTSYQSGYHGYLYAGGQILNGGEFDVTNGAITYIRNPRRTSMQVKVFDMSKSPAPVVGQTSVFNPCTVETVPITLNLPAPPTPITVDVDFTAKCTNKQVNIKPSAWVTLLDPTAAWYSRYTGVYMYNGKATVTVKEGKEYVVSAWVAGKYYSGRATFGKTSSTLVTSGGTGLTGTTNYNTSTKRVKLVATYVTNSCK
ncbi:astroprincin family protein [Arcicella rigui]|uniref:Astroprincin family protein n=1 Tax=Arcicella rigui TaxID=797020 RepID=A0ABU5QB67_9BACT|nr:astroprincin family protein [Arcicella rigui]MEA5140080.1 astroprincin family protein [Arcicella rigui]